MEPGVQILSLNELTIEVTSLKGKLNVWTVFPGYTSVTIVFLISGTCVRFLAQDKTQLYIHSVGLGFVLYFF